ncbi:alpha/beta fold hydrolase [Pandoraea sp. NPDC087047]|uniref:alpha/beta fold hydrolase n=1 Tax=Pandoraea sp. NPDC087047 TaxID=3364390 RepID=UPI00380DB37C
MNRPSQRLFLPGASGSLAFWEPLAGLITGDATKSVVGYPGFGNVPPSFDLPDFEALVQHVVNRIDQPTEILAQSMGGIIAIRAALAKPDLVTHLVLSVTSGGLDMVSLGAAEWRDDFLKAYPNVPDWFASHHSNLEAEISKVTQPTLPLWGDADPYSPVAVGAKLLAALPNATLHVVADGHHDLAFAHAAALAPLVNAHLS